MSTQYPLFPVPSSIQGALPPVTKEQESRVAPLSPAPMHGDLPRPIEGCSHGCRADGLERAKSDRTRIHRLMVQQYALGDWTDAEMAERLGIQRTTIIARRHELANVVAKGSRKNASSKVSNTTWGI